MSEIIIKRPVCIEIETIETDSYLPSFKANIKLEIKHPTGNFSYIANDIWFDCNSWDKFIIDINTFGNKTNFNFKLADISECFNIFFILNNSSEILFKISINEPFSGENGEGHISYQSKIDIETMSIIKKDFENLNKWW